MKNIFKALFAFSLLFAIGCDDVEPIMYNSSGGQTFLSFSSNFYTLPITINSTGTLDVTLNSSTVSSVDRVYDIEVIAEETNANPLTYNLPATVTIPAGSYQGTLTITGQDNGLVDATPEQLVIRISELNGAAMDSNHVTVDVVEVCPLGDDFTGTYAITQLTSNLPVNGGQPMLGNGTLVTITQGNGVYDRKFTATPYPGISGLFTPKVINFRLSCGQTVLTSNVDTGAGCGDATLQWHAATVPSTYNNTNDNVFQLTVTEDALSSCTSPRQTTLRFTKQ